MDKEKRQKFNVCILLCSMVLFSFTYLIVRKEMLMGYSDIKWHVEKAATLPFFDELLKLVSYPLFHFLVKGILKVTSWNPVFVASALLGFINVAAYLLTYYFMTESKTKKYSKNIYAVMTMVFLLLQSIYVPAFNPNVYLGQGSVNIWHNPTYIMVRPFGIAAFLLVIKMLRIPGGERVAFRKLWWMLLVVMIGCNLAKPSFSQVFIPGLGMYMVFDIVHTKGKSFFRHFQIACAFIPATILLFIQAYYSLGDEIGFEWMTVWRSYTANPWISTLLFMAFPLCVILQDVRGFFRKIENKVAVFVYLFGFAEAALLIETGARKFHGNFFWGYYLGGLLLWLVSFRYFLDGVQNTEWKTAGKLRLAGGMVSTVLLLIHLASGLNYVYRLITVEGFWY